MENNINTPDHIVQIVEILEEQGLNQKDNLVITPNISTWARENGGQEIPLDTIGYSITLVSTNPETGVETRTPKIVLKKIITNNDQVRIKQRISYPVDRGRQVFLTPLEKFIEHLTRHEIAHQLNNIPQDRESDADQVALDQMGFSETSQGF